MNTSDMTDDQLNEAIAKKRGWKKCTCEWCQKNSTPFWINPDENSTEDLPDITLDWNLAGALLEEMKYPGLSKRVDGKWICFNYDETIPHIADTPQRAICEAWLKWSENHVGA